VETEIRKGLRFLFNHQKQLAGMLAHCQPIDNIPLFEFLAFQSTSLLGLQGRQTSFNFGLLTQIFQGLELGVQA